jgi:hypothetical protein
LQDKTVVVITVIGPTALAEYFAPQLNAGGSLVLFWQFVPSGTPSMISPGVIDTGAWDSLGDDGKQDYVKHIAANKPAGRIATPADNAGAAFFAVTDTFLTGMTLRVDGGEPITQFLARSLAHATSALRPKPSNAGSKSWFSR